MILNTHNFLAQLQTLTGIDNINDLKEKKFIIALSGGIDSIVLLHLMHQNQLNCIICHVNFQLRNEESDRDMHFCTNLAQEYNLPIFVEISDTYAYAQKNGMSIQSAAREIRYHFFEKIRKHENADYILTAHHADDNIETVIFNLSMGCGFRGLHGIPAQNAHILRPLLWANRQQIKHYYEVNKLVHVEDKTNKLDKYKRNFIRHHIVPDLLTLNPNFNQTFSENIIRFREIEYLLLERLEALKKDTFFIEDNIIRIELANILSHPSISLIMYEWINPYGFNPTHIEEMLSNAQKEQHNNPIWHAIAYQAQLQQKTLYITLHSKQNIQNEPIVFYKLEELLQSSESVGLSVNISDPSSEIAKDNSITYFDVDALLFPIRVRTIENGDTFRPLGMKGQSKKVKDFVKDLKLNPIDKKNIRVWEDAQGDIIWVMPYRQSEKTKLGSKTNRMITLLPFKKNT